jgi:N-carbamoyl-L-amino-acid hydrolase
MHKPKVTINATRLLADLHDLRGFGAHKTGVHRPTFSTQDMAARRWLVARMSEAGLSARMDGIGNIVGENTTAQRRLLVGSHSDSQNFAGWLDGALGVIYGLEIARAFVECGAELLVGVDAVVFADEEAHFASFLGSRSALGLLTESEISTAVNMTTGESLRDALGHAGLSALPRSLIDPQRYLGYLEAHIEQGDDLDARGLSVGVVTSIVGIHQYRLTFTGVRNHAGTTRMAIRKDAGAALIALASRIEESFRELSAERTVWTVGNIRLFPGEVSIIPDRAEMMLQVRDDDSEVLVRYEAELKALISDANQRGPCGVSIDKIAKSAPHRKDERLQQALTGAATKLAPGAFQHMPSGAGHDAQILASVMPAGMLFVPSIGGISHHWDENTAEADIVLGCQVMAEACQTLLYESL